MPDIDSSLPDWLIDEPLSAAVFERWGLETSCGGKSLEYACREIGLDPQRILAELLELRASAPSARLRPQ